MSGTKKPPVSLRHNVENVAPLSAVPLASQLPVNQQIEYATGRPTRYLPGVTLVGASEVEVRRKSRARPRRQQSVLPAQQQAFSKALPAAVPSMMFGQQPVPYSSSPDIPPMMSDWPASGQPAPLNMNTMPTMYSGPGMLLSSPAAQSTSVLNEIANEICSTVQVNQQQT